MIKKRGSANNTWFIADCSIPLKFSNEKHHVEGHEAVVVLNYNNVVAKLNMDIFFEDRDPIRSLKLIVPANRVKCFRLDKPSDINGLEITRLVQYAIKIESDIPVIVQYARVDISQPNLSYIGIIASKTDY